MSTLSDPVAGPAAHATTEAQRRFWNHWNATARENGVGEVSNRQAEVVLSWLADLNCPHFDILEVGCGAGWFCPRLQEFGALTATYLSDEVLERARQRVPEARFVAGDFMTLDFGAASFDVVVALEVLAHVADQPAFIAKIAAHLRPGGSLMLATQNRPVLERHNRIDPPGPGQLRKWVDRDELSALLEPHFETCALFAVTPRANRGPLRLLASHKVNRAARLVLGNRLERALESAGFGWTLMALALRRA
jgi:2-polyprenyl-3-methyl-5-hydroxy-6-metoxy-1,4-benzoquinol methylase